MAKDTFDNTVGITFKLIPAGEFMMGTSDADLQTCVNAKSLLKAEYAEYFKGARDDSRIESDYLKAERPQHRVRITRPFFMATHEVTQELYQEILGRNPSDFTKNGRDGDKVSGLDTSRFPVDSASWFDAVEFCVKLSEKELRSPCYRITRIKRDKDQSIMFGLYDMHGNVSEWCQDWYDASYYGLCIERDPFGPSERAYGEIRGAMSWCRRLLEIRPSAGSYRVIRGGGWFTPATHARSASRGCDTHGGREYNAGFRVVCACNPVSVGPCVTQLFTNR